MLCFQVIALMQYFPDNKTSNFVTKLSRTLQLDGEWEVGLAEYITHILGTTYVKEKTLWKLTFQISGLKNSVFNLDITRK